MNANAAFSDPQTALCRRNGDSPIFVPTKAAPVPRSQEPRPNGRPETLDQRKRSQVLYMLGMGLSRRMAARQVGCAHTTIARTAARDSLFALDLANAESEVDIESIRRIREAAAEQKNWRAAAWLLERRNPDEFGRHTAHSLSGDRVMELLADVFSYTIGRLPEVEADGFLRMFQSKLQEVEDELQESDRWRRLAAEDSGVRGRGQMADLRSPYEHPEWHEPPAVDPLTEDVPEDDDAYAPLPTSKPASCDKLSADPSFNPEPAPTEIANRELSENEPESCVAVNDSALNGPPNGNGVLHQSCPSCRADRPEVNEPKPVNFNRFRDRAAFAPPPTGREAVQNSDPPNGVKSDSILSGF